MEAWFHMKWPIGNQMVTSPITSSHDPNTFRAQYLENSWRFYLATIANHWIVRYEAVWSAILATAWLLVQRNLCIHSKMRETAEH